MTQFRDNAIRNRAIGEFSQAQEINAIGVNIERNANWREGEALEITLSRSCKCDEFYVRRKCNIPSLVVLFHRSSDFRARGGKPSRKTAIDVFSPPVFIPVAPLALGGNEYTEKAYAHSRLITPCARVTSARCTRRFLRRR